MATADDRTAADTATDADAMAADATDAPAGSVSPGLMLPELAQLLLSTATVREFLADLAVPPPRP